MCRIITALPMQFFQLKPIVRWVFRCVNPYQSLLLSTTVLNDAKCNLMISLSTIVLNSRDWYKIIWLPENFAL